MENTMTNPPKRYALLFVHKKRALTGQQTEIYRSIDNATVK